MADVLTKLTKHETYLLPCLRTCRRTLVQDPMAAAAKEEKGAARKNRKEHVDVQLQQEAKEVRRTGAAR